MQAVLDASGRVAIPEEVRRRLGLEAGQVLEFDPEAPFLKATLPFSLAEMRSVIGCARAEVAAPGSHVGAESSPAAAWLEQTRGPVALPPDGGVENSPAA